MLKIFADGKIASRPKVRASSGMIGTKYLPTDLSFMRSLMRRTRAIVEATSSLPEPFDSASKGRAGKGGSLGWRSSRRSGTHPPSTSRRSFMYCRAGWSAGGM